MKTFTSELVIDQPRPVVYAQLREFEQYPAFMESVDDVHPIGDDRLRWHVSVGPIEREFEAEITEDNPPELIAWRGMGDDIKEAGEMRLEDAGDGRTRVRFSVAYDSDSILLSTADAMGVTERRAERTLQRLKEHVEQTA
jgi:uncharacterized membrane protein